MENKKHTAESIMELIKQLPVVENAKLYKLLVAQKKEDTTMDKYLTEKRFTSGRVCPICGGMHVLRNGKRKNGTQKFICKDCKKSFSITKNTVFSGTRKDLSVWREYMNCMAEGLGLDKSAERCGIAHGTSFTWRHKILDALRESESKDILSGIVEADETFLTVSYKGSEFSSKGKDRQRNPRKRGGENHKRGLSDELVCVPCALDRKGNAISKVAKLGKCSAEALDTVFDGRIDKDSTFCTDKDTSYRKFTNGNGYKLVQIKGGRKVVKGIYHIQHLNAYHSKLKSFLNIFKGVSTKYLNNYLVWNNQVEHRQGSMLEKASVLLDQVATTLFGETCLDVAKRPAIPLLVKNQS